MSILIFVIVIVALIVVHEFGHFVVAKWAGMRVDEFGLGYPPRALVIAKKGETLYTLNWLPFGGFVKIFGEDGLSLDHARDDRAFTSKNRALQAIVLVAGITMNLVFAYVLIVGALMAGTPRALTDSDISRATEVNLAVANILPDTPAERAGLQPGDIIVSARNSDGQWEPENGATFTAFISMSANDEVALSVKRSDGIKTLTARPASGIILSDPSRYALGVEVAPIGVIPISLGGAIVEGARLTWGVTVLTAKGLVQFLSGVFTLDANWEQVTGPVGIAGAVGSASAEGLGNLLTLVAIISINLALINLIPIPALDGGRLLFVLIESVIRRPIKPVVAQSMNAIGFIALILLMLVVTTHDIFKIVG